MENESDVANYKKFNFDLDHCWIKQNDRTQLVVDDHCGYGIYGLPSNSNCKSIWSCSHASDGSDLLC